LTLADEQARKAIANDLDVNLLVEAAAGTGKTTSLVTRIASLIRTGRCQAPSLAAITFTVKAAAHLREGVQEALEKALGECEGEERARVERAIAMLDRALIGTTHSFCARLLRERPVEAGLDPQFEELDDVAASLLEADFWSQWFDAQALQGSDALQNAIDAGVKPRHLRSAFRRLVQYADVEMVATPCSRPDLQPAVDAVLEFVARCQPCFPDDSMREKQDSFEKMMRDLVRKRDSSDLNDVLEQLELLEAGNHVSHKATLKNWPDGQQAKQLWQEYSQIASTLVRPTLRRWREYVHCLVIDLLGPAVRQFEQQRLRDGTLTFNDLLVRARDLLRDHPAVRRYFQRRFTHVLVDEFQDTDPVQAEVLFFLTGAEVDETEWRKLTPRPGSLFIVGDPKQSIYRFRRADISTYVTVRRRIEDTGGRVIALQTNFRSPRTICDFVNDTFRVVFDAADVEAGRQAQHVDLVAFDGQAPAGPEDGVYVLETPDAKQEVMAEGEARCIARWIRSAVAAGTHRYGDFLLLSGIKKRLPIYAAALEQEGVRFEITGGEAFPASEELRNVLPLLRAVADPDDTVSLAAFLRGPLCGVSDDALYRFVKRGGRWSPWYAGAEVPPEVAAGLEVVREGIEMARELPPVAALGRIFERVGIISRAAQEEQGGTRAGNALLALALSRRESATGAGFSDIVTHLGELLATKAAIEELDVDPAAADVVRLMNLHQAKGLEAPVVFLIDPVDEPDHPRDLYIDRSGETSRGYLAIREKFGYTARDIALPQNWDALATEEEAFHDAEQKRLLYVAATRAKKMLVAGVRLKKGVREGMWSTLVSNVRAVFAPRDEARDARASAAATISPEQAALEIATRLDQARASSYSVLPITKVAHDDHAQLVRAEEGLGKGTSWGRVMHRLFEALVRNEQLDVRACAENLLKDEERDPVEVDEVVSVVAAVRASELWSRVQNADERYVEVPFALMVDLPPHGRTLLHGVIDLVFREGAVWNVVDYKTDHTLHRLEALVAYYRPQVELYTRYWSELTGAPARGGLFFVDGVVEVWV
jgi:ATP-dependent helicase/nuclease subunit A